jgi:hypothetical protein
MPKFVGFTDPLPDACKNGCAMVKCCNRMHELHYENGLTDPCSAEETCFSASNERAEKIDHLDSGLEHLSVSGGFVQGDRGAENVPESLGLNRWAAIQGLAKGIEQSAKTLF